MDLLREDKRAVDTGGEGGLLREGKSRVHLAMAMLLFDKLLHLQTMLAMYIDVQHDGTNHRYCAK